MKRKGQQEKQQSELFYIKSIMARSEFAFLDFARFFLFLAIYRLAFRIGLALLSMLDDAIFAGMEARLRIFLAEPLLWSVWELVLLVPVAMLVVQFYKKIKEKNQGISLWFLQILLFVLIFCDAVLPFVSIAVTASVKAARLFPVVTSALLVFFCGVFTDSRGLKKFACWYALLPMVCLILLGVPSLYYEILAEPMKVPSAAFSTFYAIVSFVIFDIYPVTGYAVLSGFMWKCGKAVKQDEL